jgi:hypothetical protein
VLAARHAVSVRAYPEAAKNYGLAIELMNWLPEAGPDLLEEAARSASWAGDPKQAAAWAADALARGGATAPMDRARRLERLGRYRWEMGDPKAALDAAEQALVILEGEPPSRLQARVLAALGTWRVLLGDADAALPLVTKAMEVAQQTGADAAYAHGLATMGIIEAQYGDLEDGLADLHAAFTLACRAGSGTLVLSGRHHSVAIFDQPHERVPNELNVPNQTIYLPTPSGISEGHVGHELPASADLDNLASQIAALMRDGHRQTITLNGGGTLVLNGATLPFAVLCMQFPPMAGGPVPHGV